MDGQRWDTLSRRLAAAPSRRAVLGLLGGGLLLGGRGAETEAAAVEAEAFGYCKLPGEPCSDGSECCALRCRGGVCGCKKRGKNAFVAVICCSGKKKKGRKGQCA
jgi:hypothetical protein